MSIGCFLVGALGEVSATVLAGHRALVSGLSGSTGLVTELPWLTQAGLAPFDHFVFGGVDVRSGTVEQSIERQARSNGSIPWELWQGLCDGGYLKDLPIIETWDPTQPAAIRLALAAEMLKNFTDYAAGPVVVLHVASTESRLADGDDWANLEDLPDSMIWARAAAESGCAHINFTPSPAFDVASFREAYGNKIPWAGNDGKTGETLLKTVLAPMFLARNLKVMSWEGLNLLGNGDGEVLRDPERARGKIDNKDKVLGDILDYEVHSRTRIDYTPSLGDWKTAWDLIHFQGFLGVPMTLQFTWQGCDSALAAPLCLDLVRLAAKDLEQGNIGMMSHAAAFFKNPITESAASFVEQMALLSDWAKN